jgi:aldehyde dehydrogenase (NAD+)
VEAAQAAFDTIWGLNVPGQKRAALLNNLANLMAEHRDELAAIEALDNGTSPRTFSYEREVLGYLGLSFSGKTFENAKSVDVDKSIAAIKYYAGWADKITGKVVEVSFMTYSTAVGSEPGHLQTTEDNLNYTRHEPIGVCVGCLAQPFCLFLSYSSGPNHSLEFPTYALQW